MSEAQPPPPPPEPPTVSLMKRQERAKLFWRVFMISNFALGAYLLTWPKKKDETEIHTKKGHKLQKEKTPVEEVPEPPITTTSMDLIFDDDSLYFPVSIPEEARAPIIDEQQREIFKWMLEEKRKLKPKDPVEKKHIDEEKSLLKQFLRAENIPKNHPGLSFHGENRRESALKKKHEELLGSSPRGSEGDSASVGNAALIFRNDEVSESPKRDLQLEAISQGKSPVGYRTEKKPGPDIVLGAEPDLMQLHPNSAVQYQETSSIKPMSEAFDDFTKLQEKGLTAKPAFGSPFSKDPQRARNSEEVVAISFRSSNQNEVAENNLIQPNPSSVGKMISAFKMQTGLAQDMRSPTKSPPTEHCSRTIEIKASSKAQHSGKEKAWDKGPLVLLQGSMARELKQAQLCNGESRERLNSISHGKKLLNKQIDSNARNKFKLSKKSDRDEEKYSKEFLRTFAFEAVTDSGKLPEKISDRYRPNNLFDSRPDSRSNPKKK